MSLMERYRSGHNEAVLKTVCPKGRMGSNPILSASGASISLPRINVSDRQCNPICVAQAAERFAVNSEKYPSWPKGHPWKGCRSLIAARGFKSLLLRSLETMVWIGGYGKRF